MRQRLEDQNLHSLEEAMQHTPGITIAPVGAGVLYDFYSRGFPITNIAFDGAQTSSGADSGIDSQPDTALLDRMEVLRGADGLMNGSGQPGGSVNLVRKRPLAHAQTAGSVSVGSWSNKRIEFDASRPLNQAGSLRARGVLAWQERNFFYDTQDANKRVAYGVLEADLGKR